MATRKTHRKHHRRGGKSRRYRARGGYAGSYPSVYSTEGAGNLPVAADTSSYNDAGSWMLKTVGNVNTQFGNAFDQNTGNSSNGAIVGLQGQVAGRRRHRTRRGGFVRNSAISNQLQQSTRYTGALNAKPLTYQANSYILPLNKAPVVYQSATRGGKRHRRSRKSRRGGFLAEAALTKAALPLSILALQQSYKRRRHNE
jgi:hypothetical protein